VGAITAKAAIFSDGELRATALIFAGYDREVAARQVLDQALAQAQLNRAQISCLVATGYGRVQVPARTAPSPRSPATPGARTSSALKCTP